MTVSCKVFVSYKYSDSSVQSLDGQPYSTVRDYVDKLEDILQNNIYKGEHDGEDLSELSQETIKQKLSDRLYDSSITIVCISPDMRDPGKPEKDQWIPWEVSYSLRETTRRDSQGRPRKSHANGLIALVLPDANGSYGYYLASRNCCTSGCTLHKTDRLFSIIASNKFNKISSSGSTCPSGSVVWNGECSYIEAVKWCDFVVCPDLYIERASDRRERIEEFNIRKVLD